MSCINNSNLKMILFKYQSFAVPHVGIVWTNIYGESRNKTET